MALEPFTTCKVKNYFTEENDFASNVCLLIGFISFLMGNLVYWNFNFCSRTPEAICFTCTTLYCYLVLQMSR